MPSNTGQFSKLTCHILTPVSGSLSPRATGSSQRCVTVDASCCCVSQSIRPVSAVRGNVNEQIATALLRLQHDMAAVLDRLHALEALTLSQVKDQLHYVACGDRDNVISFCYHTKCWFFIMFALIFLTEISTVVPMQLIFIVIDRFLYFYIFQSRSSSPRQEDSLALTQRVLVRTFSKVCSICIFNEMFFVFYYCNVMTEYYPVREQKKIQCKFLFS